LAENKFIKNYHKSKNRFAYVFYATDDKYAIAVLVAAMLLKEIGVRDDIDFVLLHLPIKNYILYTMHQMDINTIQVQKLPRVHNNYFRYCLIKLKIFTLFHYDRVIFLDADTLPLKNLDHLFTKPVSEPISAPRAYWLPQPFVTSLLLVVKPSLELWKRAEQHFDTAFEKKYYDMDIINFEFKNEINFLPDEYGCLNSEWEDINTPFHFGDPEKNFDKINVVHFTALGKPWSYHPKMVRKLRPNAHPIFYDLWEKWWSTRNKVLNLPLAEKSTTHTHTDKNFVLLKRFKLFNCLYLTLHNAKKSFSHLNKIKPFIRSIEKHSRFFRLFRMLIPWFHENVQYFHQWTCLTRLSKYKYLACKLLQDFGFCSPYTLITLNIKAQETCRIFMRPFFVDMYTVQEIFIDRIYEPVLKHLKQCETIVDVGANIGLVSIFLASHHPRAKVLAVEADSVNYQALESNLNLLSAQTKIVRAGAWCNNSGICRKNKVTLTDRISYLIPRAANELDSPGEIIKSVTMSQIFSMLNGAKVDLLKIDIEGGEVELFKGNLDWLNFVNCIMIEFHEKSREKIGFDDLMKQHGFFIAEELEDIVIALSDNSRKPIQ
jgi:FkbM family methyltransferase